jgi:hypothetical protein
MEAGVVEDGGADASPTSHEAAKAGPGIQHSAFSKARLGNEIPS